MKIRTDFVTNSSSSSFTVRFKIDFKDGSVCKLGARGEEYMDSPDPEFFCLLDKGRELDLNDFGFACPDEEDGCGCVDCMINDCVCDETADDVCEENDAYPRSLSHILETKEGMVKAAFWSIGAKESISCKYCRKHTCKRNDELLKYMLNIKEWMDKDKDIAGARLSICFNRDCDGENHSCKRILEHIFTKKETEYICEVCEIEDDGLAAEMLKHLPVLSRYTESTIPELLNFCRNYDLENACQLFMNQFLYSDGLVHLRFNWDNDPRDFSFDYYDSDWWA